MLLEFTYLQIFIISLILSGPVSSATDLAAPIIKNQVLVIFYITKTKVMLLFDNNSGQCINKNYQ